MLLRNLLCFVLFFSYYQVFTQCAGINNSITICNKDSNTNYQSYNLFSQLGGTPEVGGTWFANNPINQNTIDTTTGIVNLWALNRFGEHTFTYTNPKCNESAEITISLGGYPGEDNINGGANACSDNPVVDLFTFLDNDLVNLSADLNGEWSDSTVPKTGFLTNNIFDAESAGIGLYKFTYTVKDVDTCLSREATVILKVHRKPSAGNPTNIEICDTDDLTPYTNINLFDYISDEDTDGIWADQSGTNQITSTLDTEINIKEIYDNFGSGIYDFQYIVLPKHGVCPSESVTVSVIIPRIKARFLVENQCKDNSLLIEILHDRTPKSKMTYDLTYEIENTTTNTIAYTGTLRGINIANIDDTTNNPRILLSKDTLPPGSYIIRTTLIDNIKKVTCNSFIVSEDEFVIYEAQAKVDNICYSDKPIDFTIYNFHDIKGNLFNGTEAANITITSNSISHNINNYNLTFLNGEVIIPLDLSQFPPTENNFNIKITPTYSNGLNCINYDFIIDRAPKNIQLDLSIDNLCDASDLKVVIDAPTLPDGGYTINYQVVEITSSRILVDNTIVFNGGRANYNVDITNLDKGFYNVILKSIQNDTTPCRTQFEFEIEEKFSINGIPDTPVLNANQSFCSSDFYPNAPTLANITVDSGENLTWYADSTSNTPLDITTPLINGEDYHVSTTTLNTDCESSDRSSVTVTVLSPQIIIGTNTEPLFCGIDNPTIANLDAQANSGELLWYDSPTGGNLLSSDTALTNGNIYYATESINGCESITRLAFKVTIIAPPKPEITGTTLLCALEKLTLFDFESSLTNNPDYEFIWYDALQGGLEIDKSELLEENKVYYIASIHLDSGCESERIPLSVTLNNCNPEDYAFFIPDGFSPNGDGVNDLYYIPNIQYFYPDYQLEIFNRYGQTLFSGNADFPTWNGQNKSSGNNVTSGVYFYILNYNKDNIKAKQGRIYLSK